jgi:hypothetical protein
MNTEDNRKPAAHEQLNEIANQLAPGQGADKPTPYASRPQPAHPYASASPTFAPAAAAPEPVAAQAEQVSAAAEAPNTPRAAAPQSAASGGTDVLRPLMLAKDDQRVRNTLITYFPMLIAVMSLALSLYQGYLFKSSLDLSQRSLDMMERNVARGEFMRTCREISETYFQVKQRIGMLMPSADRGNVAGASRVTEHNRFEAQESIAKFGGLGTYLANFQDAATRARYTELTRTLTASMESARTTPLTEAEKLFAPADRIFATMNEDCVRLARTTRM